MELDGRKMKILTAIIRNYLETGEPVGSRTISKYTDLHLSSATIRNEMADLEEMGLIVQPHTSAGRIPTDQGYRLYVNTLLEEQGQALEEKDKELSQMREVMVERVDRVACRVSPVSCSPWVWLWMPTCLSMNVRRKRCAAARILVLLCLQVTAMPSLLSSTQT